MTFQIQFSSGLELGNFVVNSDLVHQAWCAIEQQRQINPNAEPSLYNKIQPENPIVIAFGTPLGSLQGQEGLVSSRDFTHFEFLCNKSNPVFCINEAAIKLFQSHYSDLLVLKNKLVSNCKSKSPSLIIITGQSVGGIVATLFTLWLLEDLDLSKSKRPLCITFGSPLVGDEHLQKCVLKFSTWKSCFLHIFSDQDHTPKIFMSQNTTGAYKPFGTFLLCSASGCACSENPEFILEQFVTTNSHSAQTQDPNLGFPYGQILEDLKRKALCNVFESIGGERDPLQTSIITQLLAIGVVPQSQKQISAENNHLIEMMKEHETRIAIEMKKFLIFDMKLNEMKVHMAFLERYKKEGRRRKTGYYDTYKNQWDQTDKKNEEHKKTLLNYWENSVSEVENMPPIERAQFRIRWLFAGTTYRRMVEPLHIAEYYKDGGQNYQTEEGKRPKHFILLEQWVKTVQGPKDIPSRRRTVDSILNKDSCFWAHVEEALISCNTLKDEESSSIERESSLQKLKEFEGYVLDSLKNCAVNPEIFLERSSFMQWWNKYQVIMGSYYSSSLTKLMKNGTYLQYSEGKLNL
ncbi:senescence-associated carboxylesterase 101-like [Rosa rugosa]|uniref:senescence-associated carboxylesterase 101-like n=1 Tax=Rosa rugosa TaxID=74645 RepID=UPI002B407670|nr:senescence-associated carboxylesterase 101-like [Rosa rugosa]